MGNIEELQKNIKEKQAELAEIVKQRKGMTPEGQAEADLRAERLQKQIETMQASVKAMSYEPAKPTEAETLASGLNKYIKEGQKLLEGAEKNIADCQDKILKLTKELDTAMLSGNAEDLDRITADLDTEKRKLPYLQESLARIKQQPVIPEGAVAEQWANICRAYLPEWQERIANIKELAEAYKQACNGLIELRNTLYTARSILQKTGKANGCHDDIVNFKPVFSEGYKETDLILFDRQDTMALRNCLFEGSYTSRL